MAHVPRSLHRSRAAVVAGLVAVVAAAGVPAARGQATAQCGVPITTSVVLGSDLRCEGDAIIVGANRVTVDLDGHEVRADDGREFVVDGFDDVTIRNGRLSTEGASGLVHDAVNTRLDELDVTRACCPSTILVAQSRRTRVEDSSFLDLEIVLWNSADSRIRDNRFSSSNTSGLFLNASSRNVVTDNVFEDAEADGVLVVTSNRNRFRANEFLDNHDAGLALRSGRHNRVTGNVANGNRDGILVDEPAARTLLGDNVASNNRASGIVVLDASTGLRDNTADDNGEWGIRAVPGVHDLGGNAASGNGTGDCQNVDCD